MSRNHNNALKALATMLPIWIAAACIPLILSECNNSDVTTIPRRQAYPRISVHDSVYTTTNLVPINLEISKIATLSARNNTSTWIDIAYPQYNATIHCTYTPVTLATIHQAIANRNERIALDLGDSFFENTSINNPNGTSANIYATHTNMVTPIMFIATDHSSWILSGAVAFNTTEIVQYDSVSPIINALKRDLIHTMQNLRNNE